MKKILLLPILFLVLVSCSKSSTDEVQTNTIPSQLVGTWKLTGYYDDDGNNSVGSTSTLGNLHLYNDTFTVHFNSDGTFVSNFNGTASNGTFGVNSNNVLLCNYNSSASLPITMQSLKMHTFTTSVLEVYDYPNVGGEMLGASRFEKVTAKNINIR
jgi:hypothetical protein